MPNPNHRLLAKMYRRAHWLPEDLLLEIYRNSHEMCLSEVKREMLHVATKCTCNTTMGGHALIDLYGPAPSMDLDSWRDAHYAETVGLHCFHVEHCDEHPWWHNAQCYSGPGWPASMLNSEGWYSMGHFWLGHGTLRVYGMHE
jgi:hypothetical protein